MEIKINDKTYCLDTLRKLYACTLCDRPIIMPNDDLKGITCCHCEGTPLIQLAENENDDEEGEK